MTDQELILELRNSKGWPNLGNAAADRIEQLLESIKGLSQVWATAAVNREVSEGKLAKAIEALDEAIYLLDPDEEDMAKEAGLYRIVTARAKLEETE
jgi:hypothetical protein